MLYFSDSFDIYSTAWIPNRYASVTGSPTIVDNGRTGVNAINFPTTGGAPAYVTLKNVSIPTTSPPVTAFFGAAIYVPASMLTSDHITLVTFAEWGIALNLYGNGSLVEATTGASSASGAFSFGTYQYVEIAVTYGMTTMTATISVNDVQVATATSMVSTTPTLATVNYGVVALSATPTGTLQYDDLCFYDDSGLFFNIQTGDVDVFEQLPAGPGRITGVWTNNGAGSGPANWQNCNTNPPSSSIYITDATAGDEEDFALTAPAIVAPILGAQVTLTAAKAAGSGARTIAGGLGTGIAEAFGTAVALTTTFEMISFPFSNDPVSGAGFDSTVTYQAAVLTVT